MGKETILYTIALACSFIAGFVVAKIANSLTGRNNGHDYDDDGGYDDDDYDEDYEEEDDEDDDEGGEDDYEEKEEEYFDDEDLTIGDEEGITDYFGVRHIVH